MSCRLHYVRHEKGKVGSFDSKENVHLQLIALAHEPTNGNMVKVHGENSISIRPTNFLRFHIQNNAHPTKLYLSGLSSCRPFKNQKIFHCENAVLQGSLFTTLSFTTFPLMRLLSFHPLRRKHTIVRDSFSLAKLQQYFFEGFLPSFILSFSKKRL